MLMYDDDFEIFGSRSSSAVGRMTTYIVLFIKSVLLDLRNLFLVQWKKSRDCHLDLRGVVSKSPMIDRGILFSIKTLENSRYMIDFLNIVTLPGQPSYQPHRPNKRFQDIHCVNGFTL